MAVVTTKSTAVTAGDAFPQTNTNQKIHGGRLRESLGVVEAVSGDSIGSQYRLARVNSGDRISRVLLSCDAITTCAADVGVYDIASVNAGAVVDADFFASAQSLASALVNQDVTHEADAADAGAGFGLADVEKPLWQALGLASDPGKQYDIVATLTAAAGSAGTVALKVQFVNGN
ncbi:hypothetical protein [Ectopseudomonas alcaliphila]|uniref:Uncharacterized protein n=1 Tax=Ectopseudomonas alcaliphila TaxID=101564 RepID=A0A1G7JFV5_9GAMM|nr:hypothetical protein [Pseudomonas alcaliphila]MDX5990467.1 hypothetical protein [Pseudomonas alcaliphila]MDX5995437.1 hypothetical protein [Pseudomonas alcaliphila]MDX5995482.1 hypothetical protein [Pseudomonas alcaliphila]SDF23755.1 hypothetical protein SAMN05216575_106217 [Pseudomonas alcaliphila]